MKHRITALGLAVIISWSLSVPAQAMPNMLVPVGQAVGLRLETDGIYVVHLSDTLSPNPAKQAGIKPGDRILRVNGKEIQSAQELADLVQNSGGRKLAVELMRAGKVMSFQLQPQLEMGVWRLGFALRSHIEGIGTVTFYDPETGLFGALGHPISEIGTGAQIPIREGEVHRTSVARVIRGKKGSPGELCGDSEPGEQIGYVTENTPAGVFGIAEGSGFSGQILPVAQSWEVEEGAAEIWSNISGTEVRRFSVVIQHVDLTQSNGRDLSLKITDRNLLTQTGGIVQGMSGSPIIQKGKLVGAVTHVLVQRPEEGYGILIEHILAASSCYAPSQAA